MYKKRSTQRQNMHITVFLTKMHIFVIRYYFVNILHLLLFVNTYNKISRKIIKFNIILQCRSEQYNQCNNWAIDILLCSLNIVFKNFLF